jgi:hypothetical protein
MLTRQCRRRQTNLRGTVSNRNTATSVVFIEVLVFPIRNIP